MKKLITLGCSLAPAEGWPEAFKNYSEDSYEYYHYGIGGSSNGIQIHLLEDHIIKHGISVGDVFVFGLTGHRRPWGIEGQNRYNESSDLFKDEDEYNIITEVGRFKKVINPLDDKERYILIQNHPIIAEDRKCIKPKDSKFFINAYDPYIELQRLLFTLLMIKKSGGLVLVFRGWTGALEEETWHKFTNYFRNNGIEYTDECVVDWCLKNDYAFSDEYHPKSKYSKKFGEEILVPILSRQIN